MLVVAPSTAADEAAARGSLRAQVARLEGELARLLPAADAPRRAGAPHLLTLGELEQARDALAVRVARARGYAAQRHADEERARVRLERMLLAPGEHRFEQVALADLGRPGCGAYAVRPRLGLVGMLMGWWQVKLSSGCPLAA